MPEPERLSIRGNAVADTQMLRFLAMAAERDGQEYQLPKLIIERLDPEGQHVICVRPQLIPGADLSSVNPDGTGYTKLDITTGTPLPCEILTKLVGQKAPSKQMLSIIVKDYMRLEQVDGPTPEAAFHAIEGQRRRKAELN